MIESDQVEFKIQNGDLKFPFYASVKSHDVILQILRRLPAATEFLVIDTHPRLGCQWIGRYGRLLQGWVYEHELSNIISDEDAVVLKLKGLVP